jgi:small subunit ribosomal protein S4
MRYTGPKARRCRRQGFNLFGSEKYDKILQKRPTPPGKDPKASGRPAKLSEFGRQLMEKQKVCYMYGVTEKQLKSIYSAASRTQGQTDRMMKIILERRLDNALFRAGFANSRLQARQFVSHGLFTVNGQRVTIASYQIKARKQAKTSPVFAPIIESHQRYTPPDWLKSDTSKLAFDIVAVPGEDKHFDQAIDMRKVIGFYSR